MNGDVTLLKAGLVAAGLAIPIYAVLILAAQILRRHQGLRFGRTYHAFAAVAGLLAGIQLTGRFVAVGPTWGAGIVPHLAAALIILAAFPGATLLNRLLWAPATAQQPRAQAPRLLSDTTGIVVVIVFALVALHLIYEVEVPGLLAGSGVAALILGLAMQDLLANIIAGIALFVEKPFKTGDWLLIDGREARVVEITWRSVRLLTDEDVFVDVPNSKVVQESIVNFHEPNNVHAANIKIGLHYDAPPARAMDVLMQAAKRVPQTCTDVEPRVEVADFADSAIVYEVEVWIRDHGLIREVRSDLRMYCWYAVRRAGFEIPYPQLTIHRSPPTDSHEAARSSASGALASHPVFGCLSAAEVAGLVGHSPVVLYAPTERIIEQGAAGASMFLLVSGRVEVRLETGGGINAVARLGRGDCVGEMSLLTGEPRNATVVALDEVEAVEIHKDVFAGLIRDNPELLNRLTEILTRRQLANEEHAAITVTAEVREKTRAGVMKRLMSFFQLDS